MRSLLFFVAVCAFGQTTVTDQHNDAAVHSEVRVSDALGKALGYPQPPVRDEGMCPPPAWRNLGRAFCGDPPKVAAPPAKKQPPRKRKVVK